MGWARASWVLAAALCAASQAAAQARLELTWEGLPACPTGDAIEGEVARLVGGTLPEGAPIRATGRASEREGGGYTLVLTTDVEGARGERTLDAERCDELAAAAALILALMIDPEAAMRAEPIEPSTLALPEPGPPPPPPEPSLALLLDVPRAYALVPGRLESQRAIDPPRTIEIDRGAGRARVREELRPLDPQPIGGSFGLGALLDVGTLPNPSGAAFLEAGFGIPLIDARLRVVLVFPGQPASVALEDGSEITAELWAFTTGAVVCVHPIDVARWLEVCGDVEVGAIFGQADVSAPDFGAGFWIGAGGGLGLVWAPEPWFDLEVLAEVLGTYGQDFYVNIGPADTTIYAPPDAAFRFSLAAHVRFE